MAMILRRKIVRNAGEHMKTAFKESLLAIIFFFVLVSFASATNLRIGKILLESITELNTENRIEFEVRNDSVLAANRYTCDVLIKDSNAMTVYQSTVRGRNLDPYTIDTLSTTDLWIPKWTGKYHLSIEVRYASDVIPDDNISTADLSVIYRRDFFAGRLDKLLNRMDIDTTETWAFMPDSVQRPWTKVQSYDSTEFSITLDGYKYLAFVDFDKYARYRHKTMAVLYDAVDSTVVDTFRTSYWLSVNGVDYLPGFYSKYLATDLVYGSRPRPETIENANTIVQNTDVQVSGDSICAILISGAGNDSSEQAAFNFDLDLIANNLTLEKLGPRLPASSIFKMKNPTADEVYSKLESMRKKYKTIYFYYSGHGSKGDASLRDSWLFYSSLASTLYGTEAEDLVVIMDTCHSGSIIDAFKAYDYSLERTNVTVIASCSADTLSYTKFLHVTSNNDTIRAGTYTWNFALCYGDPSAESDGIEGISEKEAFESLQKKNPELNSGSINEKMMPRIFVNRATRARERVIRIPDTDLTIYQSEPFDSTLQLQIQWQSGNYDTTRQDSTIDSISDYRYWTLKSGDLNLKYDWNLEFKYNSGLDRLSLDGKPAILWRDSTASKWQAHQPSVWDSTKSTITGLKIGRPGDFALGTIYSYIAIDDRNDAISQPLGYRLDQNYPNPFNPRTTITFTVPESQHLSLKVFDALGRHVRTLVEGEILSGIHRVTFDAAGLATGLYLFELKARDFYKVKRMLIVK